MPRALTFTNLQDPETRKAAQKALAGKAGIYCIRCLKDGKCYVGSAENLYIRFCEHIYYHNKSNSHLQAAIALYGLENLEYFVIEFVTENTKLITVEQKYLDMVPSNLRYNFNPTAGSRLGSYHSAPTKAAMSKAISGENHPNYGKPLSSETKSAISQAKGKLVYVYDNNILVGKFSSYTAAAAFMGVNRSNVSRIIDTGRRNQKGFQMSSTPLCP